MDNAEEIREAAKGLGKIQKQILKSLNLSPLPLEKFSLAKSAIFNLQERELIELRKSQVFLTELGGFVCEALKKSDEDADKKSKRGQEREAKLEKGEADNGT